MNDKSIRALMPLFLFVLAACHPEQSAHEHTATKSAAVVNADVKDAAEAPGVALTHVTQATQLFVEFPALVVNGESSFAAHLTQLSNFKPVVEGTLSVTLSGGGSPEERAEAAVSKTPGIFKPVLKPQHAGTRRLVFVIDGPNLHATHDLGEVQVYPDIRAAIAAAPATEPASGIRFTKEQQWQMDFATALVAIHTLRESVAATATLRPRAAGEAQLSAPGAGLLRAGPGGFPQIGQRVHAGQTLAYLVPRLGGDTDTASLTLEVERTRAEAQRAQSERGRLESLFEVEAIPEKRLLDARTRERIAVAEARAARERAAMYQGGTGGIALKSPINGTVVEVRGAAGAPVTEGQMVIHIADVSRLWLEAHIPENDIGKVRAPSGAYFLLDDAPVVLEAKKNATLVAIGGLVEEDSRTVPAILEFDNPNGRLRAGMKVRAFVYTGRSVQATAVPASAIVNDNGQSVVFVEKEGETYERRMVQTGIRDGDFIAILNGLKANERIVTRGAYQVRLAATAPAALGEGHAH